MSTPLSSVFPRPSANDADDVVWTLQTAAVQWQRGLRADAIVWVRKAADTATQVGHSGRAEELRDHAARLAEYLWVDPEEADSDDDFEDAIEIEELDSFEGETEEQDVGDLIYYGDDDVASEANVLPNDLDLRSDSERPRGADSFMSINPDPDEARDSFMNVSLEPERRDSFMSISPEAEDETEVDREAFIGPDSRAGGAVAGKSPLPPISVAPISVAPISVAPVSEEPASASSDRPTLPHLSKPPSMGSVAVSPRADAPRLPTMPSPAATPPPGPGAPPSISPVQISEPASGPSSLLRPEASAGGVGFSLAAAPAPLDAAGEPEAPALPSVDGLALESVEALADLPEDAQADLAKQGVLQRLSAGEELTLGDGAALITRGGVDVTLTFSDVSAARVTAGAVVPARGSMESSPLRLIANENNTHVVLWTGEQMNRAAHSCPWVVDDLRVVADRYQTHASAGLGPLGARLDDALRAAVYEKLQVRLLEPGEQVATRGKPLSGLFVAAVGELSVDSGDGLRFRAGDFVFPNCVIGAEPSPHDVTAGPQGGLVLFATRPVAHELMMSVPPLLEILAS